MDEAIMDTIELIEKREHEVHEELGKIGMDDPARAKLLSEAETYSRILIAYDQNRQAKINANEKNEQEHEKICIEKEKVKNEKRRIGADVGKAAIFATAAVFSGLAGFFLDPILSKSQRFEKLREKLEDFVTRR